MNARVALIGAPGAGKTTIGSALAELWGCTFVDTDVEFQGDYGMSVAEAVIDDEATFRAREQEVVVRSLAVLGPVVAVGGGAVASDQVRTALARVPTVWLEVGLVDAARRTGLSGARPVALGNVRGQLHDMLKQRAVVYEQLADLHVSTDGRTPEEIVAQIAAWEAAP